MATIRIVNPPADFTEKFGGADIISIPTATKTDVDINKLGQLLKYETDPVAALRGELIFQWLLVHPWKLEVK